MFYARSGKRMFFKTPVLCTSPNYCKTYMKEHVLNTRYSIYVFTMG